MNEILIIGVGNAFRTDDAVGLIAARQLKGVVPEGVRVLEQGGAGLDLLEAWEGAEFVILVDAAASGAKPGTIHRREAADGRLPAAFFSDCSSHLFGVAGAIELARVQNRLPPRLLLLCVEGGSFDYGSRLTPAVAGAVPLVVEQILTELEAIMV